MRRLRHILNIRVMIGLACAMLVLSACKKQPSYPAVPSITYTGMTVTKGGSTNTQPVQVLADSIVLEVGFKDGDGDLGLFNDDTLGAYTKYFGNTRADSAVINPRFYNIFVRIWMENTRGAYDTIAWLYSDSGALLNQYYNGRFPRTDDMVNGDPVEGRIRYVIRNLFYVAQPGVPHFISGKTAYAQVSIMDRAGHRSNMIETPKIKLP